MPLTTCINLGFVFRLINFNDILIQSEIIEVLSRQAVVNIKPLSTGDTDVWIDYIDMVPTQDSSNLQRLLINPYDNSARYLAECAGKDFHVE